MKYAYAYMNKNTNVTQKTGFNGVNKGTISQKVI